MTENSKSNANPDRRIGDFISLILSSENYQIYKLA